MSAAGALSLSLALNEFLGAGFPREECVKIAHDSDAECGTGLSGVDAAALGGALFRRDLGSQPQKLPFGQRKIHLAFFSAIRTADVIRSSDWKGRVNAAGAEALSHLSAHQTWEDFIAASRHFAVKSGLGTWCEKHMKGNGRASMAMLGHTLFSDTPFVGIGMPMKLMEANTSDEGARLLK
jgi:pantoate kinase